MPKGDIHAVGTFGPWNTETPGDSTVTGKYTFQHADLNTIKGIGGTLHSVGEFTGRLDRIEVHGTADVPNFSLDTANHPVPLLHPILSHRRWNNRRHLSATGRGEAGCIGVFLQRRRSSM